MFEKGDRVKNIRTQKTGKITGETLVNFIDGCMQGVLYEDGIMEYTPDIILEKIPEFMSPLQRFKKGEGFLDYTKYRQYMTYLRLSGEFTNIFYSMKQGNVDTYAYQMKPVIKFNKSIDKRLLIADEVGLGKTVEALFIWKELVARARANRLLVVAPAILCDKWRRDMSKLFSINAEIKDAEGVLDCIKNKKDGFVIITSIQGIRWKNTKGADINEKRAAYRLNSYIEKYNEDYPTGKLLDLVVFDEAHYLSNAETSNHATALRLNNVSKAMLLLSATPVNGKTDEFYNLLNLLAPDVFFSKKQFRKLNEKNRKKVQLAHLFHDIPDKDKLKERKREIRELIYEIKSESFGDNPLYNKIERELDTFFLDTDESHIKRMSAYDDITEDYYYSPVFTRSKKRDVLPSCALRRPQIAHFTLSPFEKSVYDKATKELKKKLEENDDRLWSFCILARQRELASCMPAAIRRWTERGNILLDRKTKNVLDEDEKDELDVSYEGNISSNTVLSSYPNLVDVDVALLEEHDSKFNKFLSALREKLDDGEKVVVFSFFRGTLQYLEKRLTKEGIRTVLILGGMNSDLKQDKLRDFEHEPTCNVLLSSEVGAEGIDLQFARIEFNYDLPWNPMRLEQRIGRIDRIGQKSPIISIVNLSCKDTVEDRVLEILYEKIDVLNKAIGEIDEVLGAEMSEIQLELLKADMNAEDYRVKEKIDKTIKAVKEITEAKVEENIGLTKEYSDRLIQSINSAERNFRYLKDEDYIYYISDFFSTHGNGSYLRKDVSEENRYILSLSNQDRDLYRQFLDKNGYDSYITNGTTCSFPNHIGNTSWKIDVAHPLIKWINSIIKDEHKNADCYIFHVRKNELDKEFKDNTYVFYVSNVMFLEGYLYSNELVSIATGVNTNDVLSRDDTDYLLSAALYYGEKSSSMSLEISNLDDIRDKAIDKSMLETTSIQAKFIQELKEKNAILCSQRIQQKNEAFQQRELDIINTIEAMEAKHQPESVIKMNWGRVDKNRERWDAALEEIEKNSNPYPSAVQRALGIIILV